MKKHLPWILLVVPLVIVSAANIIAWPHLPDQIPIHFNLQGEPNDWGSRGMIWLLPGIYFWVAGFLQLVTLRLPGSKEVSNQTAVNWIASGIAVLFLYLYAHVLMISLNPGREQNVPFMTWGLGILTLSMGMGLKSCKRNLFIGIRTRWTMASDEIWDKTHSLASRLFLNAGIWMTLFAFYLNLFVCLGIIVANCLFTGFWSYRLAKASASRT